MLIFFPLAKVRREFRRRMTGNPDKKIRDAVLENKNIVQVRREMRKRVTGDPEKKIRDYMTEVPQVRVKTVIIYVSNSNAIASRSFQTQMRWDQLA